MPEKVLTATYRALVREFNTTPAASTGTCRIQLITVENALVLRIEGAATSSQYQELVQKVLQIVNARPQSPLIVDLSLCEAITSPAIGLVGFIMMNFQRHKSAVFLVNRSEMVRTSMRVMGLTSACREVASVDDALAAMRQPV